MIINKSNSEKYSWGDNCLGWHLLNTSSLSVIQEIMPPSTKEQMHYHTKTQQFFYILTGVATFNINEKEVVVKANNGMHILPNQKHQIANNSADELEFLVISEPHSHGDRENL